MPRPRVLTVLEHYRPGTKAGGPVASVEELVERLGDEFAFDIVASDRDLGDVQAYPGLEAGAWYRRGKATVRYLAPRDRTLAGWARVLRTAAADVVYLNSLFARSTVRILLLRRLGLVPKVPLVLAPRGELHAGALSINAKRKAAWLRFSRVLRLFRGVTWEAATPAEEADIRGAIAGSHRDGGPLIRVARHVPLALPANSGPAAGDPDRPKQPGHARLVFLSRISRKKNLDLALRIVVEAALAPGSPGPASPRIELDIFGPIEDSAYWAECLSLIERLPPAVSARYGGALRPDDVVPTLSRYHLFLFPTRGESFGRVVVEALAAGCPLLLSDRTPWGDAVKNRAGWVVPLDHPEGFVAGVRAVLAMDARAFGALSGAARALGIACATDAVGIESHRRLFAEAAGARSGEP